MKTEKMMFYLRVIINKEGEDKTLSEFSGTRSETLEFLEKCELKRSERYLYNFRGVKTLKGLTIDIVPNFYLRKALKAINVDKFNIKITRAKNKYAMEYRHPAN